MVWTRFMDMSSGGGRKEDFSKIYIEAPEEEAKIIFYNRFGHNPERVSCSCCGEDYSISEDETLEQSTGYDRGCDYADGQYHERPSTERFRSDTYIPLNDYIAAGQDQNGWKLVSGRHEPVAFIFAKDITDEERRGTLPRQGLVWVD